VQSLLDNNKAGVLTTITAVVALGISLINAVFAGIPVISGFVDPKVAVGEPDRIRLVQYQDENDTRIEAYVQPTFVNRGWNEQVEVIRGMTLKAQPVKGGSPSGSPMEFRWSNHGKFSATASNNTSTGCPAEEYAGNTRRLALAPHDPVATVVLFEPAAKVEDLYFEPGKQYEMTLDVEPTVNEKDDWQSLELR
jgi:hypothetical protein